MTKDEKGVGETRSVNKKVLELKNKHWIPFVMDNMGEMSKENSWFTPLITFVKYLRFYDFLQLI